MNSSSSENQIYELRATKDRGLALFAAQDIAAGSRVIKEKPLFAIPYTPDTKPAEIAILSAFQGLARDHPDRAQLYTRLHQRTLQCEGGDLDLPIAPSEGAVATLSVIESTANGTTCSATTPTPWTDPVRIRHTTASTVTHDQPMPIELTSCNEKRSTNSNGRLVEAGGQRDCLQCQNLQCAPDLSDDSAATSSDGSSIAEQEATKLEHGSDERADSILTVEESVKDSKHISLRRQDSGFKEDLYHLYHTEHCSGTPELPVESRTSSSPNNITSPFELPTAATILNIFETNSLGIEFPPATTDHQTIQAAAICLETSRLNHSCTPNLVCGFNGSTGFHTVHAIRDITAGEELSISYIGAADITTLQRQAELAKYHFQCVCPACSGDITGSDSRRARLGGLRAKADIHRRIMQSGAMTSKLAEQGVEVLREMVSLIDQEGLVGLDLADLCGAAGLCCLRAGRVGEALGWWEWKVEVLKCCLGDDGPAYLKESRGLRVFKSRLQGRET